MRVATGSKIFFRPERRIGGGFQKRVLRRIIISKEDEQTPGNIDLEIPSQLVKNLTLLLLNFFLKIASMYNRTCSNNTQHHLFKNQKRGDLTESLIRMFTCIMKIMPFSHDLCLELLNDGYSHFVIPNEQNKYEEHWTPETTFTLEAQRNRPLSKSVPIKHIMDLPAERAKKYYVKIN